MSEQLESAIVRNDQPKITDFFNRVSPEVHELATNRDRVEDLERRLKEAELLKAILEKENDNLHLTLFTRGGGGEGIMTPL